LEVGENELFDILRPETQNCPSPAQAYDWKAWAAPGYVIAYPCLRYPELGGDIIEG
jgi:hypothetical protein